MAARTSTSHLELDQWAILPYLTVGCVSPWVRSDVVTTACRRGVHVLTCAWWESRLRQDQLGAGEHNWWNAAMAATGVVWMVAKGSDRWWYRSTRRTNRSGHRP
jgi:hypothetical protein